MAIVIAGPTASGKSLVALRIAERLGGVVINADAMQVYADLRVLTARPSLDDEAIVPHRLYGHVDGAERYSVARYLGDAARAIGEATAASAVPVIVGGTGLYLAGLMEGISPIPPVPEAVRAHWRAQQAALPSEALHALLAGRDPVMAARLRPSDPQRIIRALEVIDATGRSLAALQEERGTPVLSGNTKTIVLAPDRTALRVRLGERFDAMMAAGAMEEASALAARGLPPDRPVMKAIGVAPLAAYAAGRLDRSVAIATAVTESRQYAKRQETWFRSRFPLWPRAVDPEAAIAKLTEDWPIDAG